LDFTEIFCSHASFSVVSNVNFWLPFTIEGFSDGATFFSVVLDIDTFVVSSILFHHASVNSISPFRVSLG
jgi:hypothetical protein